MASETTAASTGDVGVVRRDPMAMLPFCGYNMGNYFSHWLEMGKRISKPPLIFNVNWFRTNEEGNFIWPGFRDNFRVLLWILNRCKGKVDAIKSPIGYLPKAKDINISGIENKLSEKTLESLLSINKEAWDKEIKDQAAWFEKFDTLPEEIKSQYKLLVERLEANLATATSAK